MSGPSRTAPEECLAGRELLPAPRGMDAVALGAAVRRLAAPVRARRSTATAKRLGREAPRAPRRSTCTTPAITTVFSLRGTNPASSASSIPAMTSGNRFLPVILVKRSRLMESRLTLSYRTPAAKRGRARVLSNALRPGTASTQ